MIEGRKENTGSQARRRDKRLGEDDRVFGGHSSVRAQEDGLSGEIARVLSAPPIGGNGMGHRNEVSLSRNDE